MTAGRRGHRRKGVLASRRARGLAVAAVATAAAAAALAWAVKDIPGQFGAQPRGMRDDRVRRSPQFRDGSFRNSVPARAIAPGAGRQMLREMLFGRQRRTPTAVIPLVTPSLAGPSDTGLHIIWYGHSSALVEIEGTRLLLDPVWSERCSPSSVVGPRRLHPPPVPLVDVPPLDAIVISHDHYDHLDMATVRDLVRHQRAPFLVPIGVGAHLQSWGVPEDRIIELDWDESVEVAGARLTCTPARHFSGRAFTRDNTLWASWVIAGKRRRVFYTGDTGYFEEYRAIGATHGPFDATLAQIGAYGDGWPDIHMTPEEAVAAHLDLDGGLLVPVHWATFTLAPHAWSEPVDRLWTEAKARGVELAIPRPGERIDVDAPPAVDAWWQAIA
jgi:L-ascorbate metabolism protein UlaG (beta-lactamase superfamily)